MDLNIKVNDKNHLDIGGADAVEIAEEFGTPTYVMDEARIRANYNKFYSTFSKYYPDFKVFYACKANTNLAVMKILESEGCCIDAVSPGEVHISKMLGFSGDRILFTGNNITNDELKFVHDEGAVLNIDSVSALKRLASVIDPEGLKISFISISLSNEYEFVSFVLNFILTIVPLKGFVKLIICSFSPNS